MSSADRSEHLLDNFRRRCAWPTLAPKRETKRFDLRPSEIRKEMPEEIPAMISAELKDFLRFPCYFALNTLRLCLNLLQTLFGPTCEGAVGAATRRRPALPREWGRNAYNSGVHVLAERGTCTANRGCWVWNSAAETDNSGPGSRPRDGRYRATAPNLTKEARKRQKTFLLSPVIPSRLHG